MTQPKHLDPYTSPRSFYGAELRRLREAAGMSQERLGELAFCSGTYVGQFEAATRRPQEDLSRQFDEIFGTGEHLRRLARLARKSKHADYFADAAELETLATTICEYSPMLVPGFLQTEGYARALVRATHPHVNDEFIEGKVEARLERARLLSSPTGPVLWQILHEAALDITVGGPEDMREQLDHIAAAARTRRTVVQIMPSSAGLHPFMMGVVSLMSFADAPPVVYTESAHSGQLVEDPGLLVRYQQAYDFARAAALSPAESLRRIESAAKDSGHR
ncbi:helix-turn-helix domain-containing protein [Streptomyces sp. MAR4 CNX-425]|uniref:helix-turn-helix domain-containing protein n=1 Tax=Streptomyces sp. MAR4 CNX-425 TaxID=3406343 RepID=UPI003B505D27